MKLTMDRSLVIDALQSALGDRRPAGGMLFHSDRGIQQSMSGKGDCWDNSVVESFFGTLKSELGDPIWETRAAACDAVFDYIETRYNRKRRHSKIRYLSPEVFESLLPIAA